MASGKTRASSLALALRRARAPLSEAESEPVAAAIEGSRRKIGLFDEEQIKSCRMYLFGASELKGPVVAAR